MVDINIIWIIFFSKYVDLDLSDVSGQNCQHFEIHGTQVDSNRELDFEFYEWNTFLKGLSKVLSPKFLTGQIIFVLLRASKQIMFN